MKQVGDATMVCDDTKETGEPAQQKGSDEIEIKDYFEVRDNDCDSCKWMDEVNDGEYPCSHCIRHAFVEEGKPYIIPQGASRCS